MNQTTPSSANTPPEDTAPISSSIVRGPRRFWRSALRWLLVITAIGCLCWTLAWWTGIRQVEALRNQSRLVSHPQMIADMVPSIADDDNAAKLYTRAFILMSMNNPRTVYRPNSASELDQQWQAIIDSAEKSLSRKTAR